MPSSSWFFSQPQPHQTYSLSWKSSSHHAIAITCLFKFTHIVCIIFNEPMLAFDNLIAQDQVYSHSSHTCVFAHWLQTSINYNQTSTVIATKQLHRTTMRVLNFGIQLLQEYESLVFFQSIAFLAYVYVPISMIEDQRLLSQLPSLTLYLILHMKIAYSLLKLEGRRRWLQAITNLAWQWPSNLAKDDILTTICQMKVTWNWKLTTSTRLWPKNLVYIYENLGIKKIWVTLC